MRFAVAGAGGAANVADAAKDIFDVYVNVKVL
jgi:hypothetical protein